VAEITLAVITRNSESTLDACLASAGGLAGDIVVVDDHSTDRTIEIARGHGARVLTRSLETCGKQKDFAIRQARSVWVLLLDSDECCTPELDREIRETLAGTPAHPAYRVPRKNLYFGKWLRFGGKYPDYQTRLYRRDRVRYSDHFSHEKVIVDGSTGTLAGSILHHAYPDLDTWSMKLKRTAEFDALEWARNGVRPSALNFLRFCLFRPLWRFDRKYFLRGGFLDGREGLLACLHDVLTQILAYHLLCRNHDEKGPPLRAAGS